MKLTALPASRRLAWTASFTALAVILSYVEVLSGIDNLLPVPGTKIGIANIAVTVLAYLLPIYYALVVSLLRVFITAVLFGSVTSLFFSFAGACFSFAFIAVSKKLLRRYVSLVGASVGASALHMCGQLTAAALLLESHEVSRLLPPYLVIAVLTGILTGFVSQILYNRLKQTNTKD